MITLNGTFEHSKKVIQRINEDKINLISLEEGDENIYEITGLSACLWMIIDGKKNLDDLISTVIKNERIPSNFQQQFKNDSVEFIKHLIELKFITRVE